MAHSFTTSTPWQPEGSKPAVPVSFQKRRSGSAQPSVLPSPGLQPASRDELTTSQTSNNSPDLDEKPKNALLEKLDDIPPAVMGYAAIPFAYAATYIPQTFNRLAAGNLSTQDKAHVERLKQFTVYTDEEYAEKRAKASKFLDQFKQGDAAFYNHDAVKYFKKKHFNPESVEDRLHTLRQQSIMEALYLKYGRDIHRLQDMDGTQVHKDFSNQVNHGEPNIADQDRFAHLSTIYYNQLSRKGLQYAHDNRNNPDFTTSNMVKELIDLGYFKGKKNLLTDDQRNHLLTVWAKNVDEAFPHMNQDQVDYYTQSSIESANTARAGLTVNSNNEALSPNHNYGWANKKHVYDGKMQAGFFEMLGLHPNPKVKLQYAFDINGFQGKTVADKQVFHPLESLDLAYSGLHDILRKTPLYKKLFEAEDGVLPRVAEFKGNLTHHAKGLATDFLAYRANQLTPAQIADVNKSQSASNKFNAADWASFNEAKKARLLNYHDIQQKNRPPLAVPLAWEKGWDVINEEAMRLASEINYAGGSDYSAVWNYLNHRTRALNPDDYALLEMKDFTVNKNGDIVPNQEKLKRVNALTDEAMNAKDMEPAKVPLGSEYLKKMDALQKRNAGFGAITDFMQDLKTVDWGCFTVHSITGELNGVYGTLQEQQKNVDANFNAASKYVKNAEGKMVLDKDASLKMTVLESGKWKLLSQILQMENDPNVKKMLKEQGFDCLLRIESSSPELCYNTEIIDPVTKQKRVPRSLINMINNSSSDKVHEILPGITKEMAHLHGYETQFDPTASYVEAVMGLKIDKGAVIPLLQTQERLIQMAGDSTGSDMKAIAHLVTMSPLNTSEVVRGMIDDNKLMNSMIVDAMDVDSDTGKLAGKYEKMYKQHGIPQEAINKVKAQYEKQVLANPLRYKKILDENKKATGHVELVGKGHEEVMKSLGLEKNKFTMDEYREVFQKVFNDVLKPTVYHAEDVPYKHMKDALAKAFAHGDEATMLRILKHSHLAEQALDMIPEFENRAANSMGMPFNQGFTLPDWQPVLHKTGKSVYSTAHRTLLGIGPLSLHVAAAGGLMAAVGGTIAATTTALQLREHAKYQHLKTWDRDKENARTSLYNQVHAQKNMTGFDASTTHGGDASPLPSGQRADQPNQFNYTKKVPKPQTPNPKTPQDPELSIPSMNGGLH
jgi:hypothetical protein